jgi:DNA-binding transcriptional regulator YdaS (Cro superfamily)
VRANLKAAIEVRFGSQIAFARAVGLHPIRVNRVCNGWAEPTSDERAKMTEALRADADWLFSTFRIQAPCNLEVPDSPTVA